jgi:HAD superfamily hydrolase (TIGR01484 family)
MSMLPLSEMPKADLAAIKFVLTDIDGTLTLHGRLPAVAYEAMERLQKAGIKVIPITGRPAGWCDLIARQWPVDGVVGENGAFYFHYDQSSRKMVRVYAQDEVTRKDNLAALHKIAADVLKTFPGTAIASDQAYREIDVAVDFAEDVKPLSLETAQNIALHFHAAGAEAKVSSIHVNAWFGIHNKLTMSLRMLCELFDIKAEKELHKIVYLGDSPNDAPMFSHFQNSTGVANLSPFAHLISTLPRYVTRGEGGIGFAEFANILLATKNNP